MMRALNTAGAGMLAQQTNLDVLSNNLANSTTTGYKSQRAQFADLMYQTQSTSSNQDFGQPTPMQIGLGTQWTGNSTDMSAGAPVATNNPLNLAINGDGYFTVTGPSGQPNFTRDGTFTVNATGQMVTQQGYLLEPNVTIPPGTTALSISPTGVVTGTPPGATQPTNIGTITVSTFANEAGLTRIGGNLLQEGGGSGSPQTTQPGLNGAGTLQSGYVEGSNVQVVNEMVNMITAQRSYEINSKAIETANTMLSDVNNLVQG